VATAPGGFSCLVWTLPPCFWARFGTGGLLVSVIGPGFPFSARVYTHRGRFQKLATTKQIIRMETSLRVVPVRSDKNETPDSQLPQGRPSSHGLGPPQRDGLAGGLRSAFLWFVNPTAVWASPAGSDGRRAFVFHLGRTMGGPFFFYGYLWFSFTKTAPQLSWR